MAAQPSPDARDGGLQDVPQSVIDATSWTTDASGQTSGPGAPPASDSDIRSQIEAAVQAELDAATDPINRQITQTQGAETATLGSISKEFEALLPYAQHSAQQVTQNYNAALQASQGIFNAAQQRLNDLSQSRAAEAQKLAQQMGGPVAVGEFTAATDPYMGTAPYEFAGGMLHALSGAQAGEQQSQAFAGQVLPAMRSEEAAKARNFYESKISDLKQQILDIQKQKGGLVDDRLTKALQQKKENELADAQLKLDQLKARHDWQATRTQLAQEQTRIRLANRQQKLAEDQYKAEQTGKYKGKETQAAKQARLANERDLKSLSLQERQMKNQQGLAIQARNQSERQAANAIAEASLNPGASGKTYKKTEWRQIPKPAVGTKNSNIHAEWSYDKRTGKKLYWQDAAHTGTPSTKVTKFPVLTYWLAVTTTQPIPTSVGNKDPNRAYNSMLAAGVSANIALDVVRKRWNRPKWTPGAAKPKTTKKTTKKTPPKNPPPGQGGGPPGTQGPRTTP